MHKHQNAIQKAKEYFEEKISSGITIIEKDADKIIIDTPILNARTGGLFFALFALILWSANSDLEFYLIPFIAGYIAMFAIIWREFNLLNNIELNLAASTLTIKSNNPLKRLLLMLTGKTQTYKFSEIHGLELSYKDEYELMHRYFLITLTIAEDRKIKLFCNPKNEHALRVLELLRGVRG